jgi:hypothetical protein
MVFGVFAVAAMLVIGIFAATTAFAQNTAESTAIAGTDLHDIEGAQGLALAVNGYAGSVEELNQNATELGNPLSPRPGRLIAVAASQDKEHYIAAVLLTDGGVIVNSDEHREPVRCEGLTSTCIAAVSSDAGLAAAQPAWVSY